MNVVDLDSLSDLHLNILAYGEPGCGKTRFLGSVGECLYTLAVDVESGFKTLRLIPQAWRKNLVAVRIDKFEDLDKLYQLLEKNDPARWTKALGVPIEKPFQAVGIDTWSELNWLVKEGKREQLGKQGGDSLAWRDNLQIQDWGSILDLHQKAMEAFRDLSMTFICNMHEQIIQDERTKVIRGVPSLNGRLAAELGKYFDVVGHMSVNPMGKYVMDTQATTRYQGKSRLSLGKTIEDPTFKKILDGLK